MLNQLISNKLINKEMFSLSEEVCYLNTAYMAPLLKSVEQAGRDAITSRLAPYNFGKDTFFEPLDDLKRLFAQLIHAPDYQNIAIIPSVSYGIANVVNNIRLQPNDEILIIGDQFPSNVYPWKKLAKANNGILKTISAPETTQNRGRKWNEAILDAITSKTAVVAMCQVHWADGTLFDLAAVRAKTKQNNALLIIDGTQSVGAMPFSVQEIQPDALICAGYKWLLGPYSVGMAYYSDYFNDGTPIEDSWMYRIKSDDFANLINYQDEYRPKATRYSVGESSNFILIPMQSTALKQLLEWGVDRIQAHCRDISQKSVSKLRELGCYIEEDDARSHHLFGIKPAPQHNMEQLKQAFAKQKIYVSIRGEFIRVSSHLFNTSEDFEKLEKCFG